mmetsp:Transcript_39051/g.116578  ORF Transcript_39051/g.116578 Transcript_39051/m.116578 type:complete len:219 (+) Transcript_39051:1086-1742(+)
MPAVPLVMAEFVDPSEAVAPRPSSATPARQPSRPEFGVDDEPLVALPSFDELAALRGPAVRPPSATAGAGGDQENSRAEVVRRLRGLVGLAPSPEAPPAAPPASKLPPINAGKAAYSLPEEEEQSPVEKVVFRLAWAGIGTLIAIEIFINTPLFQQLKPAILGFLAGETPSLATPQPTGNTLLEPARDLLKAREDTMAREAAASAPPPASVFPDAAAE